MTDIPIHELTERLARVEERCLVTHRKDDQALHLARELLSKDVAYARDVIDRRLEGMNQFQKRMDRLENTFATKDQLDTIRKFVYIGLGGVLALELVLRFIKI